MILAPFSLSTSSNLRYAWWLALAGHHVHIDAGRVTVRSNPK